MFGSERRRPADRETLVSLKRVLTARQLAVLETLEGFHWVLAFVRRPLFQDPVPVVMDRNHDRHVVIEPDGTINEHPQLSLRH